MMSRFWSRITKNLDPYIPGEQPKNQRYIKLNTNECPYPPSPQVIKAIQEAANGDLRLYPDPEMYHLRETIGRYYGLSTNEVFVGNGSDELLALAFRAFYDPDRPILFPDVTYSFYPVYIKLFGLEQQTIRLRDDFTIPIDSMMIPNGGVVLPNPNAPTAIALSTTEIRLLLETHRDQVIIIDEAYIDFGGESVIPLIKEFDNLLVIQTLSKSRALAGLRIGLALGHSDLISALSRVKNSFNSYTLDRLALAGAVAAFEDEEYFRRICREVIRSRDWVSHELFKMGFNLTNSKANFVFVNHSQYHASVLYKKLRDKGILVRYFNVPRIDNYLRISIGTPEDMTTLVMAIGDIIYPMERG